MILQNPANSILIPMFQTLSLQLLKHFHKIGQLCDKENVLIKRLEHWYKDISKLFARLACILDEAGVKILAFLSCRAFCINQPQVSYYPR